MEPAHDGHDRGLGMEARLGSVHCVENVGDARCAEGVHLPDDHASEGPENILQPRTECHVIDVSCCSMAQAQGQAHAVIQFPAAHHLRLERVRPSAGSHCTRVPRLWSLGELHLRPPARFAFVIEGDRIEASYANSSGRGSGVALEVVL